MEKEIDLAELKPYENNPRNNDGAVDAVAESIRQCGYIAPIIVDENMEVLAGHTRLRALQKLNYKTVTVRVIEGLTDEQKRKYRLLDNKTNELAEWDIDKLTTELDGLDFEGFDFGFDIPQDEEVPDEDDIIEDDFDTTPPEEPKTQRGQLYKLGNHFLMCGDSTKDEDVARLMGGKVADMIFTDPPYGYSYQSNMREKSEKFEVLANDDTFLDFMPMVERYSTGFVYICTTWKVADEWIKRFKEHFNLTNIVIWDKGGGGIGDLMHTFSTDYEMILVSNRGNTLNGFRYGSVWDFTENDIEKMKKSDLVAMVQSIREYGSVWHEKKDNPNDYLHPTQKPVALVARAIRSSTEYGQSVLDLFGGSGTTLMACEQMKRRAYVMEYDPKYMDVIIGRWEQFTGQKAELIN